MKSAADCKKAMADMKKALAIGKVVTHNEVQSVQINKRALVGILWCPLQISIFSVEPRGRAQWDAEMRAFLTEEVGKWASAMTGPDGTAAISAGLPVFTYAVSEFKGTMELKYIAFIPV